MSEHEKLIERTGEEVGHFVVSLVSESERAAVVLGAAHVDFALEKLLKRIMHHHPGGRDNLFDPDRPLGTFSAKISLAFRLGLIDRGFEHALQMVRKIRNEFAHSRLKESLADSRHRNRIDELTREAKKAPTWGQMKQAISRKISNEPVEDFSASLAVILMALEVAAIWNKRVTIICQAQFDIPGIGVGGEEGSQQGT